MNGRCTPITTDMISWTSLQSSSEITKTGLPTLLPLQCSFTADILLDQKRLGHVHASRLCAMTFVISLAVYQQLPSRLRTLFHHSGPDK